MTKADALEALAGRRLSRATALFLLGEAAKYGSAPHLTCDVTYTEGSGYAIAGGGGDDGTGIWVTPAGAGG